MIESLKKMKKSATTSFGERKCLNFSFFNLIHGYNEQYSDDQLHLKNNKNGSLKVARRYNALVAISTVIVHKKKEDLFNFEIFCFFYHF